MEFKLIIGLGNPGVPYEHTYHNIGRMAVEWMEDRHPERKPAKEGAYFSGYIWGDTIAAIPKTFMNESGKAVREAAHYYKIPASRIVVVHDDADLALGTWKMDWNRGSAGHHGIESVIAAMGTQTLWRLRIGVRAPSHDTIHLKAEEFVLKQISAEDDRIFQSIFPELEAGLTTKFNENTKP